jgi:hypothetical protein
MGKQGLHPGPAREDLDRANPPRGRIAVAGRSDIRSDLLSDTLQCSEAEHGYSAKNGSDM